MIPNYNEELGFYYGVFDPRNAIHFCDDLFSLGEWVRPTPDVEGDDWEYDEEPTIEYESGGVKYLLLWLGGAPICYVTHSRWAAPCLECSPCVPGAGNLDEPFPGGRYALAPDPDTMEEINEWRKTHGLAPIIASAIDDALETRDG